jgi:hypothetical protein
MSVLADGANVVARHRRGGRRCGGALQMPQGDFFIGGIVHDAAGVHALCGFQ